MSVLNLKDSKNTIAVAFKQLLHQYQQSQSRIATKEEEAEKNKNQQLLSKTKEYTADNIVNSIASLQLIFSGIVSELAKNLTTESNKLNEFKKAIAVEQDRLQELNKVRLIIYPSS